MAFFLVLITLPLTSIKDVRGENDIEAIAASISKSVSQPFYNYDSDLVSTLIVSLVNTYPSIIAVELVDTNNDTVFFSGYRESGTFMPQAELPKEILSTLNRHEYEVVFEDEPIGQLILYYTFTGKNSADLSPDELQWVKENPVLRVGNENDWPPFDFVEDGEAKGYGIDILRLIGQKTGLSFEFVNGFSWSELLEMLRTEKLDILPLISKTTERQEYTLFTSPYVEYPTVLVTKQGDLAVQSLDDLSRSSVAIVNDYYYEQTVRDRYPDIRVVEVGGFSDGLTAVLDGRARAFIGSRAVVNYTIRKKFLVGLRIAGPSGIDDKERNKLHMGVRKNLPQLQSILEKGLKSITPEEEKTIADKWVSSSAKQSAQQIEELFDTQIRFTEKEQEWLKQHPTLRVGVDPDWPPFDFIDDSGKHSGIAADILKIFERKTGISFLVQEGLSWQEVLARAKQRELDLIPAITGSPSRSTYLTFSQPYIKQEWVYVTRKDHPALPPLSQLSDLSGKVALVRGYAVTDTLLDQYPKLNFLIVDNARQGLQAVSNGSATTFIENLGVVDHLLNAGGFPSLKPAGSTGLEPQNIQIGFRSDWPELESIVKKVFDSIPDHELMVIEDSWYMQSQFSHDAQIDDLETGGLVSKNVILIQLAIACIGLLLLIRAWRRLERRHAIYISLVFLLLNLIFASSSSLYFYLQINKEISTAEEKRIESLHLADLLRQTSDDLTRMARTYVVSGEKRYLEYFSTILAIRNGEAPRPKEYHSIYWDYLSATNKKPRPDEHPVAFEQLMKELDFTQHEFNMLNKAKYQSDTLALVEQRAIAVAQGRYPDESGQLVKPGPVDRELALQLLHDQEYHGAKARVMRNIEAFSKAIADRTNNEILSWEAKRVRLVNLLKILGACTILLILLLLFTALYWFNPKAEKVVGAREKGPVKSGERNDLVRKSIIKSWPLLLASAGAALAITLLALNHMKQQQQLEMADLRATLLTVLDTTSTGTRNWLNERQREVKSWAHLPSVRHLADKLSIIDNSNPDEQFRSAEEQYTLNTLMQPLLAEGIYTGYLIVREEGLVIASNVQEYIGKTFTSSKDIAFLKESLSGPQFTALSLPRKREADDKLFGQTANMMAAATIPLYRDNRHAVLVLLIDPQQDFSDILQRARIGESGESYAFNRQGVMISESRFDTELQKIGLLKPGTPSLLNIKLRNPGDNLTEGFTPSLAFEDLPLTLMAQSAIDGNNGVNLEGYFDYRGVPVIGAWYWDEELGLGVTSEIDVAEAYTSIREIQRQTTISLLTSLGLILALSILFVRNRIKSALAHEELVQSEELIAAQLDFQKVLLDALPSIIFVKGPDTRYTVCNAAFEEAFGISRESLIGKTVLDLDMFPLEMRNELQELDQNLLATGGGMQEERSFTLANGESRDMLHLKQTFTLKDGSPGGIIGVLIDISEMKQAERAVSEAEERSRLLLESVGEGIFGVGKDGLVNFINPAGLEMIGFSSEEIIGKQIHPIIHHSHADNSPYPVEECPMYRSLTEGVEFFITDEALWRKDGSSFPVEYTSVPIIKGDELLGSVVVFRDISERLKAERALKENEEMLSKITSSALSAIIMISSETGEVTFWNKTAEQIFGWSASDAVGKELDDLIVPEKYKMQHTKGLEHFRQTGEGPLIGKSRELTAINKDGLEFPIELLLSSVNLNGVWHAIGLISDITTRKKAEEEIRKAKEIAEAATKAKSDFLANMSHEIRTPMNAVIGLSDLCLRTDLSAKQHDYLEKIHGSANSLLGIINDILDFSKIEAGRLDMEAIPFELDKTLNSLATIVSIKAREKGIELLFSRDPDVPVTLVGDPLRLGQILTNLANNAVKFTDDGEIIISIALDELSEHECTITFRVKDSGIGMNEEQLGRLFKSFSQADTSTTRKYGGTGLGLAISKQLVELMNGTIWVESEPGKGSTFAFTARFGISELKQKPALIPAPDLRGTKVLVVDDNTNALTILSDYLEQFSFEVSTAESGEKGLAMMEAADSPFELVLLDYNMPGLNGIETARIIRDNYGDSVKIILVSALNQDDYMDDPDIDLLDNYLSKPTNPSLLFDVIMEVFGKIDSEEKVSEKTGDITDESLKTIKGARLLLVEDNKINQQVAVELLELGGFNVDIANNGQECLEILENQPHVYDCVLMDVQMPVLDGYAATARIREQQEYDDLPVLAMTANALEEDKKQAAEAGMNDHIVKPINPDHLFAALLKWIKPGEREVAEKDQQNTAADSGSTSQQLPDSLPGIDIQTGTGQVGGNVTLYLKLLKDFLADHSHDGQELAHAIEQEDLATAERIAHTLKGIGGTLGAKDLQENSKNLEKNIKVGDLEQAREILPVFREALEIVLDGLTQQFGEEEIAKSASGKSPEELLEMVTTLSTLLEEMDPEAEELANNILTDVGKNNKLRSVSKKLVKQVSGFEFEEAQETLAQLRTGIEEM